jgi:hypothetical protein
MARQYINICQSKAHQNLPNLGFLVRKQTIWQPCVPPKASNRFPEMPSRTEEDVGRRAARIPIEKRQESVFLFDLHMRAPQCVYFSASKCTMVKCLQALKDVRLVRTGGEVRCHVRTQNIFTIQSMRH